MDFATKMYHESLEILEHHIKPQRALPGIVLEQSYLDKMVDGLKPLSVLATTVVSQNKGSHMSWATRTRFTKKERIIRLGLALKCSRNLWWGVAEVAHVVYFQNISPG